MNKLASVEINSVGYITKLSAEDNLFWKSLLPSTGNSLFSFADETTNSQLKNLTQQLFTKGLPIKYSLTLNNQLVHFTAIRTTETIGYLCCEAEIQSPLALPKKELQSDLKSEVRYRELEEKYNYMFENIPYPMLIWEFETLNILDVNKAATELYGYTKEEFTKLNIKQIRPVEDIPLIEASTKNIDSYGVNHHKIWRHLKKNGELMYMEISARVFNLNGKQVSINHNQDVTERLKAEKALIESEKRFSDLFYYSPF